MTDPAVVHNTAETRFELTVNGSLAHLDYQLAGDRLRLIHIEVPPEIQGQHHAEELARAGLEYAKRQQLHVVPICPYMRTFLSHHPEYLPVVDEHWRGYVG